MTDNCGEVVCDKLAVEELKKRFPGLDITVMVRGEAALNDATIEDAIQTGLDKAARITDNGCGVAGTPLDYVGADAKESAVLQGDILVDAYNQDTRTLDANGNGLVSYVLLEGETSHQDSLIRTEWSIQTLKDGGVPLEKITGGIANWDRSQASALMEQWLKEYPGQIELVVSNNDDMALGAIDAMNRAGIGANSIKVVGIDGTPVGIKALEEGYLFGTVESDKERYSQAIFDIAWSLSLGQDPKDRVPQLEGNYYWCPQRALTQTEAKLLKNQ